MQQLEHAKCSIWIHQSLKAKHQARARQTSAVSKWLSLNNIPFWAAATYLVFISIMQSPNLAVPKAAGTKEWARAPCFTACHAHVAEEQQGLGMQRIPWNLPLLEHKQTSTNFLLKTKKWRKKRSFYPWHHFLFFICNKQMLIRHYSEPLNTLFQNTSEAAKLSGAKQAIPLRAERQFLASL